MQIQKYAQKVKHDNENELQAEKYVVSKVSKNEP